MNASGTSGPLTDCTCDVRPPIHSAAVARSISGYAVYLDLIEDEGAFDPVCPFHGEGGSMVAILSPSEEAA